MWLEQLRKGQATIRGYFQGIARLTNVIKWHASRRRQEQIRVANDALTAYQQARLQSLEVDGGRAK
eukprot:5335467-Lingulodinium_polyedra.AAC.1